MTTITTVTPLLPLYEREYNERSYNCAHFAAEVWLLLTGKDVSRELAGFYGPKLGRTVPQRLRTEFKRLARPHSPCLALFHGSVTRAAHAGVYIEGRVLHIQPDGVKWQDTDIVGMGFKKTGFYDVKDDNHR